MTPVVTVVIPTYNHGHFLAKALQSVMDQTYASWEAIVVNNFSTDNTVEVVNSFHDNRIRLVDFANKGVIAASRNKGIELARGEWIAFLDSDDSWDKTKLEKCISLATKNKADVISHHLTKNTHGQLGGILKNGPVKNIGFEKFIFHGNCLTNSSVVVRKTCLEAVQRINENPDFITVEDFDLWIKLSRKNYRFYIIDESLGEYYIHPASQSSSIERHYRALMNLSNFYFSQVSTNFKSIKIRMRLGVINYGTARQASTQKNYKMALSYYKKSLALNPFYYKTYIGLALLLVSVSGIK